jgi:hypothetical protein
MQRNYINKLSKEIHSNNIKAGWWDNTDECLFQKLQLISTEVAEATEGARKNLMDDKLPYFKMESVELADTLIRTLDLGGKLVLTYEPSGVEHPLLDKKNTIGMNHLAINCTIVDFTKALFLEKDKETLNKFYSVMVDTILKCARIRGHNIAQPIKDKLDFNAIRSDHKPENRALQNGKKF